MKRCLSLAAKSKPHVHPNPMVGSVIVYEDRIIGEGFHTAYGQPHAEVEAIRSVQDANLLKNSILYVNLEPCSHVGKTPPCADLIIKHRIPRVVIANTDPHEKVAGKGIAKLMNAGIDVTTGVLLQEGRALNRAFFTLHEKKRPYVLLKWAETSDGFIGRPKDDTTSSRQISTSLTARYTHQLRAESGAILVGTTTAIRDNPGLTTRHAEGRNPIRVVLDLKSQIPASHQLFNTEADTLIIGPKREGVNASFLEPDTDNLLQSVLHHLYTKGVSQLLVEGGAKVLQQFIDASLWDEAITIKAQVKWNAGVEAPKLAKQAMNSFSLGSDQVLMYRNS